MGENQIIIFLKFYLSFFAVIFHTGTCAKSVQFHIFNSTAKSSSSMPCCKSVVEDNMLVGARLNTSSNMCDKLDRNFFDNIEFIPGYEYYIKQVVTEHIQLAQKLTYIFPLRFGNKAAVFVEMFLPKSTFRVRFSIMDVTELQKEWNSADYNDLVDDKTLLNLKWNGGHFISFSQFSHGWTSEDTIPGSFLFGESNTVTFTSFDDGIQVSLNGRVMYKSSRASKFPPNTARAFTFNSNSVIRFSQIIFYGGAFGMKN